MLDDFQIDEAALDGATVLLASYTYRNYEGSAFVLFERAGMLYQVNGGHCSCFGLEGQWEPEETSLAALAREFTEGCVSPEYREELRAVLARLGAPVGANAD